MVYLDLIRRVESVQFDKKRKVQVQLKLGVAYKLYNTEISKSQIIALRNAAKLVLVKYGLIEDKSLPNSYFYIKRCMANTCLLDSCTVVGGHCLYCDPSFMDLLESGELRQDLVYVSRKVPTAMHENVLRELFDSWLRYFVRS